MVHFYVSDEKIEKAIIVFRQEGGVLRMSDALDKGIYRRTLYHMLEEGYITKLERGVYKLVGNGGPLSNPDLAIVATKMPQARVCLMSALIFHDMTTEIPYSVHIALPRKTETPV